MTLAASKSHAILRAVRHCTQRQAWEEGPDQQPDPSTDGYPTINCTRLMTSCTSAARAKRSAVVAATALLIWWCRHFFFLGRLAIEPPLT